MGLRHHLPCAPGGYDSTAMGVAEARISGAGKAALSGLLEMIHQSNGRRKMVRDHDEWCRATGTSAATRARRRILEKGFDFSIS